jgi:signal transduction histidine kinase
MTMAGPTAYDQLQSALKQLLADARAGTLIAVRLPGQVEGLLALAEQANAESERAIATAGGLEDEAYFVGHAIHELRTPITSVRGYSDMMRQMGSLNEMQAQFLDVVINNSRRLQSLMVDVGLMNKIRQKTLRLDPKMDLFKNIAMRVEKEYGPVASELARELRFDIPDGLPLLNTDGEVLATALGKLVENGLRYSAKDTGVVTVSAAGENDRLVVTIADNGMGIAPEDVARLGTIYFRSDDERVREYKGSGLGVPIAYGIIALLGGEISLSSQPEKGTTWTIRLPAMGGGAG